MKLFRDFLKHSLISSKGISIIMVMVIAAALAGLSLIVIQNQKMSFKRGSKLSADNDVELATNRLAAIFSSPGGCNSNFRNRNLAAVEYVAGPPEVTGTSLGSSISTCTATTCVFGGGTNEMQIQNTSWSSDITGFPIAGTAALANVSSRIRIVSANVSIDTINYLFPTPSNSGDMFPWTARLTVRFEKQLDVEANGNPQTSIIIKRIFFPITLASKNVAINSTTIAGCPKSSTHTILP